MEGKRGEHGTGGWWVTVEEARDRTVGKVEWWNLPGIGGRVVRVRQYDRNAPKDKPVWLFQSGDMYLGRWKIGKNGWPVEDGFGVTYNHSPKKCKGLVYIGEWRDGLCHGAGKSLWLQSAPNWIKNKFTDSEIQQKDGDDMVRRPYMYMGTYVNNQKQDPNGAVFLKDGTTCVGPWEEGQPVGDWWEDHQAAARLNSAAYQENATQPRISARGNLPTPRASGDKRASSWGRTKETVSSRKKHSTHNTQTGRGTTTITPPKLARATAQARKRDASNMNDEGPNDRKPAAHSTSHSSQPALRIESGSLPPPPLIISIANDDELEGSGTEQDFGNMDASVSAAACTVSDPRITAIADWLEQVISYDPDRGEMEGYAQHLVSLGLHSVQMIIDLCEEDDLTWMRKYHKRQFLANANLKNL